MAKPNYNSEKRRRELEKKKKKEEKARRKAMPATAEPADDFSAFGAPANEAPAGDTATADEPAPATVVPPEHH